jgi:hypothetical protein
MGGEKRVGGVNSLVNTNYEWGGVWATRAALAVTRENMGRATPTSPNPAYIYGGDSGVTPFFLSRADNYVPDTWSTDTAMAAARYEQASLPISGLCYSWGGVDSGGTFHADNYQMTPGGPSTWATKTAVTAALKYAEASYIGAKGYNFAGVLSPATNVTTNYEYDPSGDSWATKTAVPAPARNGQAAFTISGVIYNVWGGSAVINRNDSYVVDTWTAQPAPPTYTNGRQYPGHASIDSSGIAYVTGGLQSTGALLSDHTSFSLGVWAALTAAPTTLSYNASMPA